MLLQFSIFQPAVEDAAQNGAPVYATEKLPVAVTARLARISQYASPALRDSIYSATASGIDLSYGSGGGGGYSYGVFDGLAPQQYLYSMPVGSGGLVVHSPPQSPDKVIVRGAYSSPDNKSTGGALSNTVSPNLGYAVQSAEEDEDEF